MRLCSECVLHITNYIKTHLRNFSARMNPNYFQKLSSCLTEKTLCLHYQDKSINAPKGNKSKIFHVDVVKLYGTLEVSLYSFSTSGVDGDEKSA